MIRTVVAAASEFIASLFNSSQIFGAICIGGSGGTPLGALIMRSALPMCFPKLIVSTAASGNVSNFVGETNVTTMNSVVDIAGQNSILNPMLESAAGMIAGGARAYYERVQQAKYETEKKMVGITYV